ncbi:fatty acid desaturase family protein [Actinophytocola algeriensis]|uniref:Fatty acid desaturase n=1 Tax=Actinophytocola algeriensis TaxID=1768010 RepID=A0A7W7QFX4_9PSEU|nr:fatty acid desaturase family protein [Actinophytocola algeriensis]MBB4912862.1 fatty acid desaturase [Actinophytocola algeriensis]MBE1474059.1 fatty acid desaturase [Actinophytocola algeriensis]
MPLREFSTGPDGPGHPEQLSFDRLAPQVRRGLKELCKLDNFHGLLAIAFEYAVIALSVALCVGVSYWFYPVALVLIGSTHRFLAHLLHESSHKTFARNSVLNVIGGTVLSGYLIFHLQGPYRNTHVGLHHRNLGDADLDPDYRFHIECGLYDHNRSSRAFVIREVFLSAIGLRTFSYLKYLFRERFWSNSSMPQISTPVPLRIERLILVAEWALIIGLCAWFGWLPELLLFWFVPLCTSGVAIGWLSELAEHYPMPEGESKRVLLTRNRHGRRWEQFLLSRHADRFHLVHHLNTGVPFWNLRHAHKVLLDDPGYAMWDGMWAGVFSRPAARKDKETVISYAAKYREWRSAGGEPDVGPSFATLMMITARSGEQPSAAQQSDEQASGVQPSSVLPFGKQPSDEQPPDDIDYRKAA